MEKKSLVKFLNLKNLNKFYPHVEVSWGSKKYELGISLYEMKRIMPLERWRFALPLILSGRKFETKHFIIEPIIVHHEN